MSDSLPRCSRRHFFGQLARGSVALGSLPAAALAAKNPFAYDVSRFSQTDPKLIGWDEVARRRPIKDARRLAIGADDVVHVAAGNEIVRSQGDTPLPSLAAGERVNAVAVGPDRAVLGALRNRIVAFNADGQPRPVWQSEDPKSWFSGLAATDRDLWIADSGARIIWHCDRAGKLLGRIGQKNAERNIPGFVVPSPFLDVRLHPDGLLRVNNPGRHRIEAYTTGGDFELAWGTPTAAIAGFCGCCNPIALAALPDGRTVTCEKGLPRVKVYAADGTFESVVAPTETLAENQKRSAESGDSPRAGLDVGVDAQGRIHILDRATGEVRVMRPKARA